LIWLTFEGLVLHPVDHPTLLRYPGPIEADSGSVIKYKSYLSWKIHFINAWTIEKFS